MSRIACLHIRQFQIVVHEKHEPELKNKAFVLLNGQSSVSDVSRQKILACSATAARQQIRPGMRLSEARVLAADIIWRHPEPALYIKAHNKLIDALITCTPKITVINSGTFLLDASGFKHLGGESKLARNVLKTVSKTGFTEGQVGIADSALAAEVASKIDNKRWFVVPANKDALFLTPQSISHLPVSSDSLACFIILGIKTMGQLASLPVDSITQRFGKEGKTAWELSRGIDNRRPLLPRLERSFQCAVDLGYPASTISEAVFVLKSMLDRLTGELRQEGFSAEELILSFYNDIDRFHERPVKLLRPSSNAKFLLEIIRLSLENQSVEREFTGIELAVSRFCKESWEQTHINAPEVKESCYRTGHPSYPKASQATGKQLAIPRLPESLSLLLQRFTTRFGESSVVTPVPNDHYLPEQSGAWIPLLQRPEPYSVLPVNSDFAGSHQRKGMFDSGFVLKKQIPPAPVLIELSDSRPAAIRYQGQWHRIENIAAPERLSSLWWDRPVHRSYYTALVKSDSYRSLLLLTHDHEENNWFIDGFFD